MSKSIKPNKRKEQDIIIKSLQNCFQEFDATLEVEYETEDLIKLLSQVLIGVRNFYVTVALIKNTKKVSIIITSPKKIEKSHLDTLIEFANILNKMYSSVGYLVVDTENGYIKMCFSVELIDERLDTDHLKICFKSVLGQVAHCLDFVERANIENSKIKDLIMQYIAYSKGQQNFEFKSYL